MPKKGKLDVERLPKLSFVAPSTSERGNSKASSFGRRASCGAADYSRNKFSQKKESIVDSNESARHTSELKGLQDSLTQYFTPSEIRRSRAATSRLAAEDSLEIVIDTRAVSSIRGQRTNSISSSKSGTSTISPKSLHGRDKLEDALSLYFTPNPNKRRTHREGEYLHLSKGEESSRNLSSDQKDVKEEVLEEEKEETTENENGEAMETEKQRTSSRLTRQCRTRTEPTEKVALQGTMSDTRNLQQRAVEYRKKRENVAATMSAQLIRRACKKGKGETQRQLRKKTSQPVSSTVKACNAPSSLKNSIKNYFRPLKTAPMPSASEVKDIDFSIEINEEDQRMFDEARKTIQQDMDNANNALKKDETAVFPPKIRIHRYEIMTWYSSPYPQEYACLPILHICDYCLMYVSVPESHARKCKRLFPPGNEIYRDGSLSVFEVEGNHARVYCRNLCLLAKLFIDHKTLYFDVEPFLFYVLTLNDELGCHFVGYFSKEKYSCQKYNLACIVTLPCYQGRGFGRFLIDFSYLLSRREHLIGSPERPLSDLGKISYHSYWLSVVYEFFYKNFLSSSGGNILPSQVSLIDISNATGIAASDIVETLAENRLISNKDSTTSLILDENSIRSFWERAKNNKKRILLNESKLKWTPKIYTPSKDFRLRSPALAINPVANSPQKLNQSGGETEMIPEKKNKKKTAKEKAAARLMEPNNNQKCAPAGRVGSKKVPNGKELQLQNEKSGSPKITDDKKDESYTNKKKKRESCKESKEKRTRRREPSSDEDDSRYKHESARNIHMPSTSNAFINEKTNSRAQRGKGPTSPRNCIISKQKSEDLETDNSIVVINSSSKQNKEKPKLVARDKNMERTSGSESDESSNCYSTERPTKKRKIFRRRARTVKQQQHPKSTFALPSSSSSADTSSSSRSTSSIGKRKKNDVEEGIETTNLSAKKHRKACLQEDSSNDYDERSYGCSSASPQPIGDRLPILKSSAREHDLFVNMGGEPDTVNMGGEPDGEDAHCAAFPMGLSSYKAPVLISHPIEADDEMEEDPPIVILQQQCSDHVQRPQLDDSSYLGKVKNVEKGVEVISIGAKPTLKVPSVHVDSHKTCSPTDVATVEMPALDAAEKHISPAEGTSRHGEEEQLMVDDDAPPMLSPQAANEPSATCNEAELKAVASEKATTSSSAKLHDNTSSSNTTDVVGRENKKAKQSAGNEKTNALKGSRTEASSSTAPKTMDQQPIEHVAPVSDVLPHRDRSHTMLPTNPPTIISPPIEHQTEMHRRQQLHAFTNTNLQQLDPFATFNGALYNQHKYGVIQSKAQNSSAQQQQPQKAPEKTKEKAKKSKEKASSKSVSPEKNHAKASTSKQAAPPQHPPSTSSVSATAQQATTAPFPPQWPFPPQFSTQQMAQFAQYYQQQQYYGGRQLQQQQQPMDLTQQMQSYAATPYNQLYSQWQQATAWHQMANKFPTSYPSYEDLVMAGTTMINGVGGGGMASSSSSGSSAVLPVAALSTATASYPWTATNFAQIRHPNNASSSLAHHSSFYPPPPPPM